MDLGTLKASITLVTAPFSSGVKTVLSGLSSMEKGASVLDSSMESVGKSASATAESLGVMGDSFADSLSAIGGTSSGTLGDLDGAFATQPEAMALPVPTLSGSETLALEGLRDTLRVSLDDADLALMDDYSRELAEIDMSAARLEERFRNVFDVKGNLPEELQKTIDKIREADREAERNTLLKTAWSGIGDQKFKASLAGRSEDEQVWAEINRQLKIAHVLTPEVSAELGKMSAIQPDAQGYHQISEVLENLELMTSQIKDSLATLWQDPANASAMENLKTTIQGAYTASDDLYNSLNRYGDLQIEGLHKQLKQNMKDMVSLMSAWTDMSSKLESDLADFFNTIAETGKVSLDALAEALSSTLRMEAAQMTARALMHAMEESVLALVSLASGDGKAAAHWTAAGEAASAAAMYGGFITGSALAGMAHSGISDIPEDGTWLLKKGERVLDDRTNQDLKGYLKRGGSGGAASVNMPVTINGGDEQSVMKALPKLRGLIEDVVNGNIAGDGSIRQTIKAYL